MTAASNGHPTYLLDRAALPGSEPLGQGEAADAEA